MKIPTFWKTVIGIIGGIVSIVLILVVLIWVKGGTVSEALGNEKATSEELVEEIDDYQVKEEFMEYAYEVNTEVDSLLIEKPKVLQTYVIEYPKEITDGLYVLYSPTFMDNHKIEDALPRYIEQENAYPVNVFYVGDAKSGVIGYQIFAEVSGKEFSEDVPVIFLVEDGKLKDTYNYPIYASELPVMD